MNNQQGYLGGRLPLLDPRQLSGSQKAVYDQINVKQVSWAERSNFLAKTAEGRLIGPFNPVLFSPEIATSFLALQAVEEANTSLDERVRQVIILSVGAVWSSHYELYAHAAVARTTGLSEQAITSLTRGDEPDDLKQDEKIAHRFALQLSSSRRIDAALYQVAENTFGHQGLVDITFLVGIYEIVCGLLNAFAIPAPPSSG